MAMDQTGSGAEERDVPQARVDVDDYESRWSEIQVGFVDQPQVAVESAGTLVAELMDELTRAVEAELAALAGRTSSDGGPTTEDLRVAFQGYREVFDRLAANFTPVRRSDVADLEAGHTAADRSHTPAEGAAPG